MVKEIEDNMEKLTTYISHNVFNHEVINSQVYYQSKGRNCYLLKIDMNETIIGNITYSIYQAIF